MSIICNFEIHYILVGGWLCRYLKNMPIHKFMLKRITRMYSQTHLLVEELYSSYKFNNVIYFPNFRFYSFQPYPVHESGKLKLVFMARMNRMKGLDTIIEIGDYLDKTFGGNVTIDFYGPFNNEDKDWFLNKIKKFHFMKYCGEVAPQNIYQTLSQYDVMLLPTHYYTEGFPGSVLDAYISGIPVIVTKWKYANEFIDDGTSGFIIPFDNPHQELCRVIMELYNDEVLLSKMKNFAYEKSKEYSADIAYDIIKKELN